MASIPVEFVQRAACKYGGIPAQVVIEIAKDVYKRYVSLQPNEKQRDEVCSKIKIIQGILQKGMETAMNTRDDLIRQTLLKVQQNLKKCEEICKEIEKKSFTGKLRSVPDDIKKVKELNSLLDDCISIATLHFSVSNYTTLPGIQDDMKHFDALIRNPQRGMYRLNSVYEKKPEKVEKPIVKEDKPGELLVSWKQLSAEYYELEYDRQNRGCLRVESTRCMLDSTKVRFPDSMLYKIRVRGVNGCGPGEWSETTVGTFTILPEQPRKPLAVYVNSYNSVTLVVEKPVEREGTKPVSHFVVEYHNETNQGMTKRVFSVDTLHTVKEGKAFKIDLNWRIAAANTYNVQISHRNKDGDSHPCEDVIKVNRIPPGEPVGLELVHTTTRTIIIEWSKPKTSSYVVDHYEVQWGRNGNIEKKRTTPRCYAVFRQLQTNKKYLFKVRAVNKMGYGSEFIEIDAETKSMAGKVAKALGAGAATGAATTVMSPFSAVITGVAAGAGAGAAAAESVEDKGKGAEVAAGAAAGIGGGVAGFALGLLITPFVIVASPFVGTATGISAVVGGDEAELNEFLEKYPDDSKDIDIK